MLQSEQLLNMHKVFESIVVDLKAFDGQFSLKGVGVELPYFIVIDVQLLQLFQVLQTVYLNDFVAGGL